MDELDQGTWSTPPSDTDKWSAVDEDDSVEVFVFGADEELTDEPTPPAPPGDEPLAATLTSDDVAGDDWNDDAWLESLDSFEPVGEPVTAPARDAEAVGAAPAATPPPAVADHGTAPSRPTAGGVPAPSAFVAPPPSTVRDEQLDEALQSIDRSGARAGAVDDADVAGLLRELSMLSNDD